MCMIRWIFFVKYGIICTAYHFIAVKLSRAVHRSLGKPKLPGFSRYNMCSESLWDKIYGGKVQEILSAAYISFPGAGDAARDA